MTLIHYLRTSCEQATALMEKRDVAELGLGERAGLWIHMRICKACHAYEEQSQALEQALEQRKLAAVDTSALEERILGDLS